MNATVPEKLYLDATSKCGDTVFTIKNNDTDIEYIKTDTFIEKAKKWFEIQNEGVDEAGNYKCDMTDFEDFINYMEGE